MNLFISLILSFYFVSLPHAMDGVESDGSDRGGPIILIESSDSSFGDDESLSFPRHFQAKLIPFVLPPSASSDFYANDYWQAVQNPEIKPQDLKTYLLCFKNRLDASIFFVKVEALSSCPIVLSSLYQFQGARFNIPVGNGYEYGEHLGTVERIMILSPQWGLKSNAFK